MNIEEIKRRHTLLCETQKGLNYLWNEGVLCKKYTEYEKISMIITEKKCLLEREALKILFGKDNLSETVSTLPF